MHESTSGRTSGWRSAARSLISAPFVLFTHFLFVPVASESVFLDCSDNSNLPRCDHSPSAKHLPMRKAEKINFFLETKMKDKDTYDLDVQRAGSIPARERRARAQRHPVCGHDRRRRRRDALDPTSAARHVQAAEPRLAASDTRMIVDHTSTTAQSLQSDLSSTASSAVGVWLPGERTPNDVAKYLERSLLVFRRTPTSVYSFVSVSGRLPFSFFYYRLNVHRQTRRLRHNQRAFFRCGAYPAP
ncbi:hypothetical protein DFH11DRAFT_512472 [Phellopilus nigrolimitatus]|nr:hypothetical protein DFH11DRAFT_512472 [Phellopilus nigrolimitatus]